MEKFLVSENNFNLSSFKFLYKILLIFFEYLFNEWINATQRNKLKHSFKKINKKTLLKLYYKSWNSTQTKVKFKESQLKKDQSMQLFF
jgi:hypothetical protein